MSYRPDDWDEISFNLGFATPHKATSDKLAVFSDGIEAGADAMVRAFVERYKKSKGITDFISFMEVIKIDTEIMSIPDEEAEKIRTIGQTVSYILEHNKEK